MGSGSSSDAPKETQSAPVTARTTPKQPKRNRQFEEVQIAGQGGTKARQPARSTGSSPKPHQSSSTSKNPRGTDPGASGSTTDRSKPQQNTPRQGAAANGKKDDGAKLEDDIPKKQPPTQTRKDNMPSQQDIKATTFQELVDKKKKREVNKRIQSIKEEDDVNNGDIASGQAEGDLGVKDIEVPSGSSQPSNGNQVTVGHGSKFQTNQVKARELAQAKFQTEKDAAQAKVQREKELAQAKFQTEKDAAQAKVQREKELARVKNRPENLDQAKSDKVKATTSNADSVHVGDRGAADAKDVNKTGPTNTENKERNGITKDNRNLGKSFPDKSVPGKKEQVTTTVNTAVMNGDIDNEDLEELDNLSYDHGDESDFSDEEDQGHVEQDSDHDVEGHNEGHSENEAANVTAASIERTVAKHQARNKNRTETVVSMKDDDIVFETFYHRSGKEFQCIYQSGMRFYLDDWGSKEWQPFPKRWYNEGLLVTNTILKDENAEQNNRNEQAAGASGQGQSSRSQGRSQGQGSGGASDDREGFLLHPSKGRVPTYIFYKKHNVHMYFDKITGSWVRMPVGWELHHDMVKSLVDQVEEAVPNWGDRHDILSLLRACNYDPDECISIYLHLEKDEWMKGPKTSKENKVLMEKEARVLELEKRVRHLEIQLQKEIDTRQDAERNLEMQMTKFTELEAESKDTEAQLSAVTGGRPPTARPFSRLVKPGQKGAKGVAMGVAMKGGSKQVQSGEAVNPDDVIDLNANAKELRKAHTRVKMDVERFMGDMKHMLEKVGPAFKQMKQSEKGTLNEIEEVRALYRKEALQRRLLYNQLQELRGNIRVFCRVRKDDRAENCLKFPSDQDLIATHQGQKKMFNFDRVFDPSSTQEAVFEDTKPIITSCADGYNVCLLAYGQTGSGKTFTMMGPDSNPGINIRAMKELFQVCSERKETMTYKLTVSLVEIYNETIQDLLSSDAKTLELRTAGNKVQIPGLIEHEIKTVDDVKKVMSMGDKNRSVASTKMNSTSSRSHLVLMLAVEGNDKVTSAITRGTLVLCDLAGSERISKTEAEGQRLVEAAAINKSLSALGQVFSSLRSSQLHIPYRNSKLTQILQPSLGGDAKACLFVNVSPDSYNFAETVSTLGFGSNARQVALGQAKQNISKGKG